MNGRLTKALGAIIFAGTAWVAAAEVGQATVKGESAAFSGRAHGATQETAAELVWSTEIGAGRPLSGMIADLRAGNSMLITSGGDYVSWTLESGASYPPQITQITAGRSPAEVNRHLGNPTFFSAPTRTPTIPGYELRSAQKLNIQGASGKFIGVYRKSRPDRDGAIVVVFDDGEAARASSDPIVVIRSDLPLAAASVTAGHHGQRAAINVVSDATSEGVFTLQQYLWVPH